MQEIHGEVSFNTKKARKKNIRNFQIGSEFQALLQNVEGSANT